MILKRLQSLIFARFGPHDPYLRTWRATTVLRVSSLLLLFALVLGGQSPKLDHECVRRRFGRF